MIIFDEGAMIHIFLEQWCMIVDISNCHSEMLCGLFRSASLILTDDTEIIRGLHFTIQLGAGNDLELPRETLLETVKNRVPDLLMVQDNSQRWLDYGL